jgi:hypothetical protein
MILATAAVLLAIGVYGSSRLRFSHDPVGWFRADAPTRVALLTIDEHLRGGTTLEVVVDTGRENGLHDPALLMRLEVLGGALREDTRALLPVSGVFSINDVVKETNQALHANRREHYQIPAERETLIQELFLFENSGSDDLERLVDSQYRLARITIKTPYADGVHYRDFVDRVRSLFASQLDGKVDVTVTGSMALVARAIPKALESMAVSYVAAFVVISFLMIVLLGSIRLGLLSMIPNLLPIIVAMGTMGILDVPIDLTTIMVGSIALGLVVDDTIHFMYNYKKYHDLTGDVRAAVEASFLGAGRAMVVTSAVLVVAFGVDILASLSNIVVFGLLVALIIVLALLADFLVAPALMRLSTARHAVLPLASRALPMVAVTLCVGAPATADELEAVASGSAAETARQIMRRVEDRHDGDHVTMELQITLVDRRGLTRVRRARSFSRDREGGTDSILFFLDPPEVRGTGFLSLDHDDPARSDDQWLFLPALGRSKRVSTGEKSGAFMGSDFSYADLTRRSTERYEYRLLGEREVEGRSTWQIEAVPIDPAESEETGYQLSILFVRPDINVVVRAVHWLRDSDDRKHLEVNRLERIDGIWTPIEVHMARVRGRDIEHRTIVINRNVRYDEPVPESWFTPRRLEKGP